MYAQTWQLFHENDQLKSYYNIKRSTRDGNIIDTWVKEIPYDSISLIDYRLQKGKAYPTLQYANYSHTILKMKFDCAKLRIATLTITEYDTDGKIIMDGSQDVEWDNTIPESVGEAKTENICSCIKYKK